MSSELMALPEQKIAYVEELPCVRSRLLLLVRDDPGIRRKDVFGFFRRYSILSDIPDEQLDQMLTHYAQQLKNWGRIRITSDKEGEVSYHPRGRIEKRAYGLYYKVNDFFRGKP